MKVIHINNLPSKFPITFTISLWLLLDRFQVPGWAWGVFVMSMTILWAAAIYGIAIQETVNIFEGKK